MTPPRAEELSGGQAALRADAGRALVTLRAYLEDLDARFLQHESSVIFEALDRVEAYVQASGSEL